MISAATPREHTLSKTAVRLSAHLLSVCLSSPASPAAVRDCTVGIEGTSIKAGIIKCAHQTGVTWKAGEGFSRTGEVTLRACARAAKATGLPITTHTEVAERIGLAQCALFEEEGVDMNRVYIGHNNDSTDMDYLLEILGHGVWLGLDRTTELADSPDWYAAQRKQAIKLSSCFF